jgi:hypothetical protein
MNAAHPVMQQALQPFRPLTQAEREAIAAVQARQHAEDQRRAHRALQDQQQYLGSMGALS